MAERRLLLPPEHEQAVGAGEMGLARATAE
jgi:hypothetical protein